MRSLFQESIHSFLFLLLCINLNLEYVQMAHWTHDLNVSFEVHDYDEFIFCRISHIASLQNSVRRLRVRQHINQLTESESFDLNP